jgi:putative hemolysin
MKTKIITAGIAMFLSLVFLSACAANTPKPVPATATLEPAQIANPATANCELKGYRSKIRTKSDGSQYGVCIFPDKSACEEWAFYRGECAPLPEKPTLDKDSFEIANPASVHCLQKGGKLETRGAADGSQSGVCVFTDKSECDEWAFFKGECAPGSSKPSK